jgi:hypothetical protein
LITQSVKRSHNNEERDDDGVAEGNDGDGELNRVGTDDVNDDNEVGDTLDIDDEEADNDDNDAAVDDIDDDGCCDTDDDDDVDRCDGTLVVASEGGESF